MVQSTSSLMTPSSTDTGKVSTGTYAGSVRGFPVRRSKREPWRGHSTVHVSWSNSPCGEIAVVVRAAVLDGEDVAGAVEYADLEVLPLHELALAGGQLLEPADVDHGTQIRPLQSVLKSSGPG